ncbi:glycoside hydrolase domain-containing protein [Streptomyces sp. NPDC092369]|uniref:glycoside hydrolase domain-containing protein n=1 Tax=Streptomyces sp. NPDC092369 TaxID=3366015 RepID=UPI0038289398
MADEMVERAQQFINSYNVSGIPKVEVNGKTSWTVMYALTRALQYELGITSLSDTFGPTTLSTLQSRFGAQIDDGTRNDKVYRIIQSGLYCKGYDGGGIDGTYSGRTADSVAELKSDMGVGGAYPGSGLQPKVFKALLTMDPYVRVGNGTEQVRTIQQWLNGRYVKRREFFICPADGNFSRDVQKALVFALQYEIGMSDDVANGRFGPGTQDGVRAQAMLGLGSADGAKQFVHLFQAAMRFNGWDVEFDGFYSGSLLSTVVDFQRFAQLLPTTGTADFRTWASLLVSTGDPSRAGTAADCITEITPARAQALRAAGYTTVGRYLTNANVTNPKNKKIQPGELANIVAGGLSVFPIYQTNGGDPEYFNAQQGATDALAALEAARGHGFKAGTILYFSVDYDAVDEEITSRVIPHFRGLVGRMTAYGSEYRVGVYAPRNICSRLSKAGLTVASFVSDMSTGYSGNLGFPLPKDWAFDQIATITVGSGTGFIEIDKDVASGRDVGQSQFAPRGPDTALDVPFDMSMRGGLTSGLVNYIVANGHDDWYRARSAEECIAKVLDMDALITGLARSFRMRKSLIQAVVFWEYQADFTDEGVDVLVDAYYNWKDAQAAWEQNPVGSPPTPPTPTFDDSSTGVAQIFGRTAIRARNHCIDADVISAPIQDPEDWRARRAVWNQLRNDDDYNVSTVPLIHIWSASLKGVTTDRLRYSDADNVTVLARYNGTTEDAQEYGRRARDLYNIFEAYNAVVRG